MLGLGRLGAVWVVLTAARAAWAQSAPHDPDLERRQHEAQRLFRQAQTHYNLAEYDQAIDLFKQAYQLVQAPGFLFNLGQAYRLKGDCAQALQFYKNYLREEPDPPDRAHVEDLIADMQKCVDSPRPPPQLAPSTQPLRALGGPNAPAEISEDTGKSKRIAGLVTGGAGVALLVTAIAFGVSASSSADDVNRMCTSAMPCAWQAPVAPIDADGRSAATTATVLYVLGGAALAGGGILYYLGWRDAEPHVTVTPQPAGLSVGWACRF